MFDSKGQSSSVFNLLIAALVSLAILGLLLSVLGGIDIFSQGQNPTETATKLIKNASNNAFSPYTDTLTFSNKYKSISGQAISSKTDVGTNLLFVACQDLPNLDVGSTSALFKGTSTQKYQATAVCGAGVDFTIGLPEGCSITSESTYKCYLIFSEFTG